MKKLSVKFDSDWVLSRREDPVLPVEAFLQMLQSFVEIQVLEQTMTECAVVIKNENFGTARIRSCLVRILSTKFRLKLDSPEISYSIKEYNEAEEKTFEELILDMTGEEEDAVRTTEDLLREEQERKEQLLKDTVAQIDALVGAEDFKALARECAAVAPGLLSHNIAETFIHRSYLFAINDGDGLSTYLDLFAKLIDCLELFKMRSTTSVLEITLPAVTGNSASSIFDTAIKQLRLQGERRVVCIDISAWMSKVSSVEFRDFLDQVEAYVGKSIIVFRTPFVEQEILEKLRRGLADQFLVRQVAFVPFDMEELVRCAQAALESRGFTMEEGAWEIYKLRISEEKSDGKFYGIDTVHKIVREMLYAKLYQNAQTGVDDTVVKKEEILSVAAGYDDGLKPGLDALDDMVGMAELKQRILEVVSQIEASLKNKKLGTPCIHMRFLGNPGTGKTTVARILGRILKEKGILRNGNFFEYAGRDFCGRYVGETAPKTAAMCRDAYGSVMFIDEAYSLYRSGGSKVDFGREALDTLIAEMENHRSDLVVIMAGYTKEMEELMEGNPGLASRMPYIIEFPNYTRQQLTQIFLQMAGKTFSFDEAFKEAVQAYFDALPDEVLSSESFSNARFVRNLYERTWGKAVLRCQLSKEDTQVLKKEDFLAASAEKEFSKLMRKPVKDKVVGFAYQ